MSSILTNGDLAVTVNGMRFLNPFVIGSGPPSTNATVISKAFAAGWGGVAVGAGIMGYGLYGLGSYASDLSDSRGVASTNKHWLGSTLTLVGAGTAVASYFLLLREPHAEVAKAPQKPLETAKLQLVAVPMAPALVRAP